jgi:recombination protein RecA
MNNLKNIFGDVDKMNPDGGLLDDNCISTPSDWIDTGSKALNAIISGSLYKGIPVGRITGFSGPSGAGKTLIINKILANAQKKGYIAVIWDSEVAVDKDSARNVGMDLKKTKYYPVETIEDCRNQISTFLDAVIAANDPKLKFIISIDSLGNLASSKEIEDARKGKDAADVGQRAKATKSMMRSITYKAAKAGVPILFSNHIYEGMEMFPSLIKNQAGGKGPVYLASILVQLATRQEKTSENPNESSIAIANNVSGVTMSAMTVKNRIVPPFLKTELYLNFRTGLDVNTGLFELAVAFGVLEQTGSTYQFNGEKLGYRKNIEKDASFWEKIYPVIEQKLNEELKYGAATSPTDGVVDDLASDDDDDEDIDADDVVINSKTK